MFAVDFFDSYQLDGHVGAVAWGEINMPIYFSNGRVYLWTWNEIIPWWWLYYVCHYSTTRRPIENVSFCFCVTPSYSSDQR